jgi:O-antigen/teichoic acid export membrane protein
MQSLSLRKLVSNYTFLVGGEALSKVFTFVAFTFLARVLGPSSFGHLEFVIAVMVLFSLLVDFGTSPYGAREIAKQKDLVGELVAHIFTLRVILAFIGYVVLIAFTFLLLDKEDPVRRLLLLFGLTLFGVPGFLQWVFQGFDKMSWVGAGSVIRQSIFAIGIFLFIRNSDQLWLVALIECSAVAGFAAYCIYLYTSRLGQLKPSLSYVPMKLTFLQSLPIGLSQITWASTWYLATILLGLMVGGSEVGWFSAAHRPVVTLHTFIWLYFYNLFPSMSRSAVESESELKSLIGNSLKLTTWAAVFLGIAGTLFAEPMIMLVFGPQYAETVSTFSILIWLLPIALCSGHYRYALIAANQQRYEFVSQACAALAALFLGLLLIPKFAAHGAAVSLLIAAIINWILAYVFVRQKVCNVSFAPYIFRPLAAGGVMVLVFQLLLPFNIWLAGSASIGLYISSLIGFVPEVKRLIA